jgi:hypothetical protein
MFSINYQSGGTFDKEYTHPLCSSLVHFRKWNDSNICRRLLAFWNVLLSSECLLGISTRLRRPLYISYRYINTTRGKIHVKWKQVRQCIYTRVYQVFDIQWGTCFMIDDAASGVTKWRHDVTSSVDVAPRKKNCIHFSKGFIQKKTLSIPASCRFFIRKTD